MEYPYDSADFSPFTKAYLELLRKHPLREQPAELLLAPLGDGFPNDGAALLHTLAHHCFQRADLGWRELYYRGDDEDIEPIGSWDGYNVEAGTPNWFDPDKGILLGESAGGEVYFGVHWDGGALRFFEVDVEDEEGEPIKVFDTVDAFWDHIHTSEYDYAEMEGADPPEFLTALFEAAGKPLDWPA